MTDVNFVDHGSIWIADLLTEAAQDWVSAHVSDDAQWFGPGLVVEPRYVPAIAEGMIADGLTVTGPEN